MGLRPLFRIKSLTPDTRLTSQRQLLRPPRHFETPTPPGLPTPAPAHHHCCALHHRLQQTHRSIDFATPCFHRRPRHHQSSPRQPVQPPTTKLTFRTSTSKHSRASPSARHFHIRPAEWIFFSFIFKASLLPPLLPPQLFLPTTTTRCTLSLWRLLPHQLPFQHTALLLGTRLHLHSSLLLRRPLDAMGG